MPACIANMAMDNEERKLAATEFAQITQWFYAVTADGTTKDWAKKLVETLEKSDKEKGEAYTDRKMLRLFRQGFIAKTAKPMGNHDKWLFVVDPELNALPIDWLIRAYQRFIIS
jgi:RNA polymerase-interacting CarD/CdnL/TRCF family regulator